MPYFLEIEMALMIFKIGKIIRLLKKIDMNFITNYNYKIEISELIEFKNKL